VPPHAQSPKVEEHVSPVANDFSAYKVDFLTQFSNYETPSTINGDGIDSLFGQQNIAYFSENAM